MLWPITLCALDIIVQTAMGAESDIQFEENVSFLVVRKSQRPRIYVIIENIDRI